jgi:hypothetical protein
VREHLLPEVIGEGLNGLVVRGEWLRHDLGSFPGFRDSCAQVLGASRSGYGLCPFSGAAGAQGEVQEETERSEHEGERQRRDAEWRPNATAEAVKPNESPRDEVKGEHMEPHGEAAFWGCE